MYLFLQTFLSTFIILGTITIVCLILRLFISKGTAKRIGCHASEISECEHCALSEISK